MKGLLLVGALLSSPPSPATRSVAVLPFENRTGDVSLEWVSAGLSTVVATELGRAPSVEVHTVYPSQAPWHAPTDQGSAAARAADAARNLGVDAIVWGALEKGAGGTVRLEARAWKTWEPKTARIFTSGGMAEQLVALEEGLAQDVARAFGAPPPPRGPGGPEPPAGAKVPQSTPAHRASFREQEDEATRALLQGQQLRRTPAWQWYNRGATLADGSDFEIACYRKALELDPALVEAHYNLGIALAHRDDRSGALDEFRAALARNQNPDDRTRLKQIIQGLEDGTLNPKSLGNLTAATQWFNRGASLGDDSDEEAQDYRKALEADPTYAPAHYNLGNLYARKARPLEALKELRLYLKYTSDPADKTDPVRAVADELRRQVLDQ